MNKPRVVPDGSKWCPGCTSVLSAASFGPDRSRPPLFLQGRCRACVTRANDRKRKPIEWTVEVAKIADEVSALPVAISRVLTLPAVRGRGRKKLRQHPEDGRPAQNWRDLLDGGAAREDDPDTIRYFPERITAGGQDPARWPDNWIAWAALAEAFV